VNEEFGEMLKQNVINCLSMPEFAQKVKSLSLSLASVAKVELMSGKFQNCFNFFQQMAEQPNQQMKLAGILCLSYTCQDLPMQFYEQHRDVIIGGLLGQVNTQDIEMTRQALNGFCRAKLVTREHFQDDNKRNFILAKLVECFQINNEEVLVAVWSVLNDISTYLYSYIGDYLQQIGDLTLLLIQTPELSGVASQALEFWTSLCYIEQDFPERSLHIVQQTFEALLTICFTAFESELKSQDKDVDINEDNEFTRIVAFQGLNLAQNVLKICGQPVFDKVLDKARTHYFGKDTW
jgi:hypothetical protein